MSIPVASPSSIETAYINQFKAGFEQAFQQFDTRLAPYVQHTRQASEFDFYDRIGVAEDMTEDTTRYGDNPLSEIPHDRRRIGLRDYELGKYIDPKDLIRTLTDPSSEYQVAMRAAGHRKIDDIIIDATFGPAYVGKKGENIVNFVSAPGNGLIKVGGYSSGNSNPITTGGRYVRGNDDEEGISVAADFGGTTPGSAVGINLAKLKAVRTTMMRLDSIKQETILNCFISAAQFEQLLSIDEVINSDYAVRKALAEGSITTFMGYRFIHAERLPVDSDGNTRCIVSLPNYLKFAVAKDLELDAWRDTAKKMIPYIYFKLSAGASRMWGEVVAEVKCSNSL